MADKEQGKKIMVKKGSDEAFTPQEFEELEKKEGKKIMVKKPERPKDSTALKPSGKGSDVDMLVLKTEKIEGKIEAASEDRKVLDERISGLNQEIGELRSSILEKDKLIREFQSGFTKIKDTAESMDPERIARQFAKSEQAAEKLEAEVEKMSLLMKTMKEELVRNTEILDNVKDTKNLTRLVQTLKEKMGKIEENKKYTARTAGKIETMFTDLSDKLAEFQSYKDKIAFNEETMHEIMKSMDMVEARLGEVVKKSDLKKSEGSVDERLQRVSVKSDDSTHEVKSLLNELLSGLEEAGVKGVLEKAAKSKTERMFATREDLERLAASIKEVEERSKKHAESASRSEVSRLWKELERLRKAESRDSERFSKAMESATRRMDKVEAAPPPQPATPHLPDVPSPTAQNFPPPPPAFAPAGAGHEAKSRIESLIDQAEENIKKNDLDGAKNLYRQALSLYNQMKEVEDYQEADAIFNDIRKLYTRLRIYS